jgi:hypothetical protein
MLNPDDRSHLFQLLRPPLGYNLDYAVGTTFSLDLFALLTLPIAFASMDWETAEGEPTSNPVVLLEAVRRYTDRMTIFSQAGRIAKPRKHQLLFAYLESSITEVRPSNPKGVFHPKVWILRFTDGDRILYRLLCLSRNLTFDRSWDTVISMEGHLADRVLAITKNHVLGNFLAALPDMAIWRMVLSHDRILDYKSVDERHPRLRSLLDDTVRVGAWKLLWIPPSLPYYQMRGPFADTLLSDFTKRLIFSSWQVAPKAIACMASYAAEREVMRGYEPHARNTPEARIALRYLRCRRVRLQRHRENR